MANTGVSIVSSIINSVTTYTIKYGTQLATFDEKTYETAYKAVVNPCNDISIESSPEDYLNCVVTTIQDCAADSECDYEVLYFIVVWLLTG